MNDDDVPRPVAGVFYDGSQRAVCIGCELLGLRDEVVTRPDSRAHASKHTIRHKYVDATLAYKLSDWQRYLVLSNNTTA